MAKVVILNYEAQSNLQQNCEKIKVFVTIKYRLSTQQCTFDLSPLMLHSIVHSTICVTALAKENEDF